MLPDIGASELMVIAIVALIFVGPKDLPVMLRKLGQFTTKMRRMASEFRSSFDDMARQTELDDLRREVEEMRKKTEDSIGNPLGVDSAFQETMNDIETSFDEPFEPYVDPDAPVATIEPAPAKAKTPRKKPATTAAAKAVAPAKTAAKATPRKRAAPKIVT